ncbi:MAG: hypothetical protein IPK67_04770 [Planctomycetes bacterium]|nr:hypothetical protein [Planctomycetota bacterium]
MKPLHGSAISQVLRHLALGAALTLAALSSCTGKDGDRGPQGPAGPPGSGPVNTALAQGDDLPGVNVVITGVSGGSGAGGRFLPGDTLSVNFTLQQDDGTDWDIGEFGTMRALVSGPTFNYQRVMAEKSDLVTTAVLEDDGSYTYTFPTALPATYLAPLNDSASFGVEDGELTGQALLDGTYSVGVYGSWDYTVDGATKRDADDAVFDFVIGQTGTAEPRTVVGQENCNRCHEDLQIHGSRRKNVALCVLCHNSGSEDRNNGGGTLTPGVSIDFKVMIHKIHAGEHLPSVLGVATNLDGTRDYAATPAPYELIGFNNSVADYSGVAFPAWPNGLVAMPRDLGYTALAAGAKVQEDTIRTGPSACIVCHGDPDDTGPITAPAQGDLHRSQPSRAACGSCHDDVHWGQPYTANGQTMPAQANNSNCILCHATSGDPLAVADAHLHPLLNSTFNSGLVVDITDLVEAGTNDADGTIDAGEKVSVTFNLTDDLGVALLPSAVGNFSVILSAPTENYNLLLSSTLPTGRLTGAQPFTTTLPTHLLLERLGTSTGSATDVFTTAFSPHWNVSGATTSVFVRTGFPGGGGNSTAASATVVPQNWIDVASATGFARDDYVVIDDGTGSEEYLRIQSVIGTRLWFGTSGSTSYAASLRFAHAAGAGVREVTLATKVVTTDYTLNANTGQITEVADSFGSGNAVLSSYTSDFVMPTVYPPALNDSGDLDETVGKWAGKSIVDGTYSLGLWSARTLVLNQFGEANSYRSASNVQLVDFLVGSATDIEPYGLISSGNNCYNCHQDVEFHGAGRRSFEACVICHSTAGSEDRPQLVAPNAPETPGVPITFRTMLHKIHMGEELANASTYEIVGFGSTAYPNNFGISTFEELVFPTLPGGVRNCFKCHGATNDSWKEPLHRDHPTQQGTPVARWAAVCGACHDSTDAQAHIQVQTTGAGAESCGVCHDADAEWSVERVHRAY